MIRDWNEESLDHRNALLYAMGVTEADAQRPIIGLVNSWNEMNPGHFPLKDVVEEIQPEDSQFFGLDASERSTAGDDRPASPAGSKPEAAS